MDLKSFSALNRVEKEFDVVEGLKVTMHTLSVLQQQQALAELPTSPLGMDTALRAVILQQALLIYAIDAITVKRLMYKNLRNSFKTFRLQSLTRFIIVMINWLKNRIKLLKSLKKK